jgi:hypothetical protein
MNVGYPTRKVPAFEEVYSREMLKRETENRKQKSEFAISRFGKITLKIQTFFLGTLPLEFNRRRFRDS